MFLSFKIKKDASEAAAFTELSTRKSTMGATEHFSNYRTVEGSNYRSVELSKSQCNTLSYEKSRDH